MKLQDALYDTQAKAAAAVTLIEKSPLMGALDRH
jgi:hypothetical protein